MVEKNFGKLVVYIIAWMRSKHHWLIRIQLQEILEMIREVVIFKNSLKFVWDAK
jgi:hypothetical protein